MMKLIPDVAPQLMQELPFKSLMSQGNISIMKTIAFTIITHLEVAEEINQTKHLVLEKECKKAMLSK